MPAPALVLVPAIIAGVVRMIAPKLLRRSHGKKHNVKQVANSAIPKNSKDVINMNRNAITSEKKLEQAYRSTRKTQAKRQISGKANYNFGNPGSIKGKASGGTVKNYANGGGVRKAKFMDN